METDIAGLQSGGVGPGTCFFAALLLKAGMAVSGG